MNNLEELSKTPGDSDLGFLNEVDLKNPDIIKKTKYHPFCPENKIIHRNKYNDCMIKVKPKNYTRTKKLIGDWSDKKIIYFILGF